MKFQILVWHVFLTVDQYAWLARGVGLRYALIKANVNILMSGCFINSGKRSDSPCESMKMIVIVESMKSDIPLKAWRQELNPFEGMIISPCVTLNEGLEIN